MSESSHRRPPRLAADREHAKDARGRGRVAFPWASLVAGATGILSGMSIGGGSLLVPALVLVLGVPQHVAQGVVLATFPAVAAVAAWIHWRQGFLRWRLALRIAAGSAVGAGLGARVAVDAPDELLRRLFGLYLVGIGLYALYRSRR
ncbi:MAG TPA: sulfite exporter TauE/SafE family protein [Thermaerobacter sp.]